MFSLRSSPCFPFEFSDTAAFPGRVPYRLRLYREHANEFATGSGNGAIFQGRYRVENPLVGFGPAQEEGQFAIVLELLRLPSHIIGFGLH